MIFTLMFLLTQHFAFGQCNPDGNVSRYEFDITPLTNINLTGPDFCTSQSMGNGCCVMQSSYRCLDMILNFEEGPNGEMFNPNNDGTFTFTTSNGNFDALFFSVGTPNPMGNALDCQTDIPLGNNFDIIVSFTGTVMNQIAVVLTVKNNMGVVVSTMMETANPGESVIFTSCKTGFGCLEGTELIFGSCDLTGTLDIAPGAPSTVCEGTSTTLKIAAGGGVAPYEATIRCITGVDTTYLTVDIPSDGGDPTMDMIEYDITPIATRFCSYTLVSMVDITGCVEPIVNENVMITVNPVPVADAGDDQNICPGAGVQLNGSGGVSCAWSPGTGLSSTSICNPVASPVVPTTYTLTVTNNFGCTGTDQVLVDVHLPVAMVCNNNVQVSLGTDGTAFIIPDDVLEGTYDDQYYTVTLTTLTGVPVANPVTCSNVGQTLRARVTDICNGNFCQGTITVLDNLPPTAVCDDVFINCAVSNYTPDYLYGILGIVTAYPDAGDNCNIVQQTYADTWFDLGCNQTINGNNDISAYIERVWTVRDQSNNQATCTQYIYIERIHVYDVIFPGSANVSCEAPVTNPAATGVPYYIDPNIPGVEFPLFPGSNACELNIGFTDQILPVCDGTYSLLRTWTVYDACLPTSPFPPFTNPLLYVQSILVEDTNGPVVDCPDDLTVGTNSNDCESDYNLPNVIIEDACSQIASFEAQYKVNGIIYTLVGTLTTFPGNNPNLPDTLGVMGVAQNLPLGTTEVKYIITDDCGNASECIFNVTVEDETPPAAVCDEITQVSLLNDGMVLVNATTFDDGSYDNCSPVEFKARRLEDNACQDTDMFFDQVKFCCTDVTDTVLVILRVYDVDVPAGPVDLDYEEQNSNDCIVQVYVGDNVKPECIAPANITVSCENFDPSLWAYGNAIGTDNCCLDTLTLVNTFTLFDTTCNKGTIMRRWTAVDCAGQTATCTQRVVVNYEQDYFIRFPSDKLLFACDSTWYQEPAFFGEDCELLAVSYHDDLFTVIPDACFKIERTWTIINWCTYNPNAGCIYVPNPNPNPNVNSPQNLMGPTVSAAGTTGLWTPTLVKINPSDPLPTDYSTFWYPDANCYEYKQIIKVSDNQDPVVANCPATPVEICDYSNNDAQLWNEPYWFDAVIASQDMPEAPSDLSITATDACGGTNITVRYLLFLDLDQSGDMETVVNSNNLPGYNTVLFNNINTPNYLGGEIRNFDERAVPANQKFGFALQTTVNAAANTVTASVRWNTAQSPGNYSAPQLPYGTHKIKWIVEDGCGNEKICEYIFTVRDCEPPTVVCINGLSANITPAQTITLTALDFLQFLEDNTTPAGQVKLGIRRTGSGTGFPTNPDGSPQTTVSFDCNDLGTQFVELWGMDLEGNADYCETYVIVQDNQNNCGNSSVTVAGALKTELQDGLENADVELSGSHPALPPISLYQNTTDDGAYLFSNAVPIDGSYTIVPAKNDDYINGVSTYDLVLINKHILGIETFNSPFKIIAADANNSKSVTMFDIAEIRKLILGIYTELPEITSWRFVDAAYTFPTPDNPFVPVFPETKSVADVQTSQLSDNFVSIKTGDVNGSAVTNNFMTVDDRTTGTLLFDVNDQEVMAGDEVSVSFKAAEKVAGYQFTITFNGMEVLDLVPGEDMTTNNFGVFADAITTSFDAEAQGSFTVKFRANKAGNLRHLLGVSSRITKAEAYSLAGDRLEVALRFNGNIVQNAGFELYQNEPNPFADRTVIGFYLTEQGEATLTIFDESGRLVYTQKGDFEKGNNTFTINREQVNHAGLLYYKLESGGDSAVMKMIQTR